MACLTCGAPDHDPWSFPRHAYSYLLGQYLGDGCLTYVHRGVWKLRIACTTAYPDIIEEVAASMVAVMPKNRVGRYRVGGCTEVHSHSKQWICLFPQHGPGRKHDRRIALEPWQWEIVEQHREPFLRGLIHSDGSRYTNTVKVNGKQYAYPRYEFCNVSGDIKDLCTEVFELIGVEWRTMNRKSISVARRESVARLDEFIGPKT